MPQKAKGENTFSGRYEGQQVKETPRADKTKKESSTVTGTEAKFDYSKAKIRG